MDMLDMAARRDGYDGGAFYVILGEVYSDWQEPKHRKRRYVKPEHTKEDWEAIKERYAYQCFYCGRKSERLTKDHIIAVSKGGSDLIENIVPSCMRCNRLKATSPIEDFKNGAMVKLL